MSKVVMIAKFVAKRRLDCCTGLVLFLACQDVSAIETDLWVFIFPARF